MSPSYIYFALRKLYNFTVNSRWQRSTASETAAVYRYYLKVNSAPVISTYGDGDPPRRPLLMGSTACVLVATRQICIGRGVTFFTSTNTDTPAVRLYLHQYRDSSAEKRRSRCRISSIHTFGIVIHTPAISQ